jgi:hypothetical protein
MKTPAAVLEAQSAVDAKAAELTAARALVERLSKDLGEAQAALHSARVAADMNMPRCRLVSIKWNSGNHEEGGVLVIERKTPAGKLVVRRVGSAESSSSRWMFEWCERSGAYREKKARHGYSYSRSILELRDVPPEFMPAQQVTA